MIFTDDEKRMYQVMEALYDSGIPISFKGSMVLKAVLQELGYKDNIRSTKDIDGNWYSNEILETKDIEQSINKVLNDKGLNYYVETFREHAEGRSAGFNVFDKINSKKLFSMDIDVNRPRQQTKLYILNDVKFSGIIPEQIIADKLLVISSNKVFRRIKDVIDLYYLSSVVSFEKTNILKLIANNQRVLGDFSDFIYREKDLCHAYNKYSFSQDVEKPEFYHIYSIVTNYVRDFLPTFNPKLNATATVKEIKSYNNSSDNKAILSLDGLHTAFERYEEDGSCGVCGDWKIEKDLSSSTSLWNLSYANEPVALCISKLKYDYIKLVNEDITDQIFVQICDIAQSIFPTCKMDPKEQKQIQERKQIQK